MKIVGIIAVVIAIFLGVVSCGIIGFGVNTATTIVTKTLDPDNIIYNYEWFKRQYADINAFKTKMNTIKTEYATFKQSAGPREKWTFEDKQQDSYYQTQIIGLTNQVASMIAEYNAKSRMINRSIFKGTDLPEEIDPGYVID